MLIGMGLLVAALAAGAWGYRRERAAHAVALRQASDRYAELESAYNVAVAATFNRVRDGVVGQLLPGEAMATREAFDAIAADERLGVQDVLADLRERMGVMHAATSTARDSVMRASAAADAAKAENAQLRVLLERALSLPSEVDEAWLKAVRARAKALLEEKPAWELAMAGRLEDALVKRYVEEHSAHKTEVTL